MTIQPGLKLLLNYNRLTGNTFFGWYENGESRSKRIALKIWNMCLLIVLSVSCYIFIEMSFSVSGTNDKQSNVTLSSEHTSQFDLLQLLFATSTTIFTFKAVLIALYLTIFGGQLMTLLSEDNGIKELMSKEYRTAKWIVICQVSYALLIATLNFAKDVNTHKPHTLIAMFIQLTISTSTQVTILSLIGYKSLTVRQHFDEIVESNSGKNLIAIYGLVIRMDKSVKLMDKYVSIFILLFLLFNQIFCVSSLCHMALNSQLKIIEGLLSISYGFVNISVLCLVCNIIPSSLISLVDKLDIHLNDLNGHSNEWNDIKNRQILMQMRQMSDRIGFTAFGLFRVNSNTFLSCLALIISYSVIIIQTGQTDTPKDTSVNTNCSCSII